MLNKQLIIDQAGQRLAFQIKVPSTTQKVVSIHTITDTIEQAISGGQDNTLRGRIWIAHPCKGDVLYAAHVSSLAFSTDAAFDEFEYWPYQGFPKIVANEAKKSSWHSVNLNVQSSVLEGYYIDAQSAKKTVPIQPYVVTIYIETETKK